MSGRFLWPREHGAWAMLLLPFFGGAVLAGRFRWESLAALTAVVGLFTIQEPLLALLRQCFVWRERREAADDAVFTALITGLAAAAAGGILLWRLPGPPLVILAAVAFILLGLRAVLTLGKLQRSAPLQVVEAAGLSATSLLGFLAGRGAIDERALLLWGLFSLHHTAALFVIRARLEAIVSARSAASPRRPFRMAAWAGQALLLAVLVAALMGETPVLAAALAVPFLIHTWDLVRLDQPLFLKIPLARVGWREVAVSSVFSVLVVASFLV